MSKTCSRGHFHDGLFGCPFCQAEDENRRLQQRESEERARENDALQREVRDAAWRGEMAAMETAERVERAEAAAAHQHRESVTNAWKLQAQAKADQAFEMYNASLYAEAVQLAQAALSQDPSNLDACCVAAWAAAELGSPDTKLVDRQLGLLRTGEYGQGPASFRQVLDGLPEDDEVLTRFNQTVCDQCPYWTTPVECAELLWDLVNRNCLVAATAVVEVVRQKWPSLVAEAFSLLIQMRKGRTDLEVNGAFFSKYALANSQVAFLRELNYLVSTREFDGPVIATIIGTLAAQFPDVALCADSLRLVEHLHGRQMVRESRDLCHALVTKTDQLGQRLALHQIASGLGDVNSEVVLEIMRRVPVNSRSSLIDSSRQIVDSKVQVFRAIDQPTKNEESVTIRFTDGSLALLRQGLDSTRTAWAAEIEKEHQAAAEVKGKEAARKKVPWWLALLMGWALGVITLVAVPSIKNLSNEVGFLFLGGCICVGILARQLLLRRFENRMVPQMLIQERDREESMWRSAVGGMAATATKLQ